MRLAVQAFPWVEVSGWIEATAISVWMRESLSVFAFPGVLTLHTLALAVVAGVSIAIDLRILGIAPRLPLPPMRRFFPILWVSFLASALSGVLLFVAYPAKALTNPMFFFKMLCVAVAVLIARRLEGHLRDPGAASAKSRRGLVPIAWVSLASWTAAIVSGRLLAYTYRHLMSSM